MAIRTLPLTKQRYSFAGGTDLHLRSTKLCCMVDAEDERSSTTFFLQISNALLISKETKSELFSKRMTSPADLHSRVPLTHFASRGELQSSLGNARPPNSSIASLISFSNCGKHQFWFLSSSFSSSSSLSSSSCSPCSTSQSSLSSSFDSSSSLQSDGISLASSLCSADLWDEASLLLEP